MPMGIDMTSPAPGRRASSAPWSDIQLRYWRWVEVYGFLQNRFVVKLHLRRLGMSMRLPNLTYQISYLYFSPQKINQKLWRCWEYFAGGFDFVAPYLRDRTCHVMSTIPLYETCLLFAFLLSSFASAGCFHNHVIVITENNQFVLCSPISCIRSPCAFATATARCLHLLRFFPFASQASFQTSPSKPRWCYLLHGWWNENRLSEGSALANKSYGSHDEARYHYDSRNMVP